MVIIPSLLTLALALSSVSSSALASVHSHGSRRSHRALSLKRSSSSVELSPRDLYQQAAERAHRGQTSPRKRSSCSIKASTAATVNNSSSVFISAIASPTTSYTASAASAASPVTSSAWVSASSPVAVTNIVLGGVASSNSAAPSSTNSSSYASAPAATSSSTTQQYNSPWKLDLVANGTSFFDSWTFWDYADPTHGTVDYVSSSDAWSQGLVSINTAGNAIMKVDTTDKVSVGRKSVRIHSTYIFNGGLILIDAKHMPTGCGTWGAAWANGPDWPNGGEIDIIEGVNGFAYNQVSLHTSDGCTIPASFGAQDTTALTTGNFDNTNCASYATSNQGCGERSKLTNSYGTAFNENGGGVYAMKWDTTGISVFFFPRDAIPADVTQDTPVPSTWGLPMANFPSTTCDPFTFFKDNFAIFDTTFCGDWAGNIWNDDSAYAGQSQSCAASTGYSTCADYVLNEGSKFTEAYWEVKSVKYYQPA